MHVRKISSWRANAARIASGYASHSRDEPSTSVNRKVTVPVGSDLIGPLPAPSRKAN
jgi:hypothetical protein